MKTEHVRISVTFNGYVVEGAGAYEGRFPTHSETWTFESMKRLQERLPEILGIPYEKREPEITKRK